MREVLLLPVGRDINLNCRQGMPYSALSLSLSLFRSLSVSISLLSIINALLNPSHNIFVPWPTSSDNVGRNVINKRIKRMQLSSGHWLRSSSCHRGYHGAQLISCGLLLCSRTKPSQTNPTQAKPSQANPNTHPLVNGL